MADREVNALPTLMASRGSIFFLNIDFAVCVSIKNPNTEIKKKKCSFLLQNGNFGYYKRLAACGARTLTPRFPLSPQIDISLSFPMRLVALCRQNNGPWHGQLFQWITITQRFRSL
jgi:hypothetical protein